MLMLFALPLLSTVGREAPETSLSAVGPPTTSTVGGATVDNHRRGSRDTAWRR